MSTMEGYNTHQYETSMMHETHVRLSENMEGRPTRWVYNEIITCAAIFLNLEESRSHRSERETGWARGQGTRPTPLGGRPTTRANQAPSPGSCSTASNLQGKLCD